MAAPQFPFSCRQANCRISRLLIIFPFLSYYMEHGSRTASHSRHAVPCIYLLCCFEPSV